MIDAADRSAGIVDGGRNCSKGDVNYLDDAELDVLLQGSGGANVKRSQQLDLQLWRDPILARNSNERDILRNEMTDPPQKANSDVVGLGERQKVAEIDEPNVTRPIIRDRDLILDAEAGNGFRQIERPAQARHQFVDYKLGFSSNSVDNVVDADR